MPEITIKLTTQQAVPVMMAISNQMNNSRNMRLSLASGGSKERQEILDCGSRAWPKPTKLFRGRCR